MRDYKKIKAYQHANKLVLAVYSLSKNFPKHEIYGLTSQIRRASISVPTNIAEGASRQHKKDYLNFLYNSRGSVAEVEYLLELASNLDYLNIEDFNKVDLIRQEAAKTLSGLIESVEQEVNLIEA